MKKISLPSFSSEPDTIKCKHCGSTQVRPSHKSSGANSHVTYRCQACKRHFRVGGSNLPWRLAIAVAVLLGLVLAGMAANRWMLNPADVPYKPETDAAGQDALEKIQQDAKQGDPQAQYTLGRTFWLNGEYQKAFQWIKTAADQSFVEAEFLLGQAYLNGLGTLQNYRAALEYFSKAANKGHLEAEYRLGILYRDGLAAPPDKEAAYLWLNIAAAGGHADALQYRDKLAATMTTEELNRAQEASAQKHALLSGAAAAKP